MLLLTLMPATASMADDTWLADLPVVSDGTHAWLTVNGKSEDGKDTVYLYHAELAHDPPAWEKVVELNGVLARGGLAAGDGKLVMVFRDGTVQMVYVRPAPIEGQWYISPKVVAALPSDATVRSLLIDGDQVWAMVRVESQATLEKLDTPESLGIDSATMSDKDREIRNMVIGLPRIYGKAEPAVTDDLSEDAAISSTDNKPEETIEEPPSVEPLPEDEVVEETPTVAVITPDDRLVRLRSSDWGSVALPEDWPRGATAHLTAGVSQNEDATPVLLVQPEDHDATKWRLYHHATEGWSSEAFELDSPGHVLPLRVGGQLVLVQHHPTQAGFMALSYVMRSEGPVALGDRTLDLAKGGRWTVWPGRQGGVSVVAGASDLAKRVHEAKPDGTPPGPTVAEIDLHGQPVGETLTFERDESNVVSEQVDYIILLVVVVSSTMLLFTFWRRDPTVNELALPNGVVLADLTRRAIAGMVDLTPGIIAGVMLFDITPSELYTRWPGRGLGADWSLMLPGVIAIAVIVTHTAILETLTSRSLGKMVTGLRVTTLSGLPPRPWQTLVRCLLKLYDLVAYLLLVLPMVSPYRQRLGDMVARTVVVMNGPLDSVEADEAEENKNQGETPAQDDDDPSDEENPT